MPEPYRVGVYYAPTDDDLLWQAGCAWLGRDAQTGLAVPQPDLPGLAEHTIAPRRYGLHATLKAPFAPRHGFDAFLQAATNFAARQRPFGLPRLQVTELEGFLALCERDPSAQLQRLADACVMELDQQRQPESALLQAQRAIGRTPRQMEHIVRWGYPLVFEDFQFHITLTGQMEQNPYYNAACQHFAPSLAQERTVKSLAVFVEDTPGSAFRLCCHLPFAA